MRIIAIYVYTFVHVLKMFYFQIQQVDFLQVDQQTLHLAPQKSLGIGAGVGLFLCFIAFQSSEGER